MVARLRTLARGAVDAFRGLTRAYEPVGAGPHLLVLTYHRVLPRTFADIDIVEPGMYVYDDSFADQLRWLRDEFEVVSLADWIRRRATGAALPHKACAITFDDGWRDNFTYGFPLLHALQLPATIFVVSSLVGTRAEFWPERLARAVRRRTVAGTHATGGWLDGVVAAAGPRRSRSTNEWLSGVIASAKRFPDETIHRRLDEIEQLEGAVPPAEPEILNWGDLESMTRSGLISVGSHTRNHVRLVSDLPSESLHAEVVGSAREIAAAIGRPVELFCYPNGDASAAAEALVRSHYVGACTTMRGWNGAEADAYRLCRMTMHEGRGAGRLAFFGGLAHRP